MSSGNPAAELNPGLESPPIRVYTSSTSFNKEVKRKQAGVIQVLEAKKISHVNLDISSDEAAKLKLRELMASQGLENSATIEIPQIFNRDTYCGNYDDFFWAVEDAMVEKFLFPAPPESTPPSSTEDSEGAKASVAPPVPASTSSTEGSGGIKALVVSVEQSQSPAVEAAASQQMKMEDKDFGPEIRVYTSLTSFSKEVKRKQAGVIQVLEAKKISHVNLDISSDEAAKLKLRELMTSQGLDNSATIEIPQIFNRDTYCGNYDDFFWAVEDAMVEKFLFPAPPVSKEISEADKGESQSSAAPVEQEVSSVDGGVPVQPVTAEATEPLATEIRVYTSSTSFSKEVKRKQAGVIQVLEAKKISHVNLDISSDEAAKLKLRELMTSQGLENSATIEIPQIFNRDTYCGNYDDFFWAVEDGAIQKFLAPPRSLYSISNLTQDPSTTVSVEAKIDHSDKAKLAEKVSSGTGVEISRNVTGFSSQVTTTEDSTRPAAGAIAAISSSTKYTKEAAVMVTASEITSSVHSETRAESRAMTSFTRNVEKHESNSDTVRKAEKRLIVSEERKTARSSVQNISISESCGIIDRSANDKFSSENSTCNNNIVRGLKTKPVISTDAGLVSAVTTPSMRLVTASQTFSTSQCEQQIKSVLSRDSSHHQTSTSSSFSVQRFASGPITNIVPCTASSVETPTVYSPGTTPVARTFHNAENVLVKTDAKVATRTVPVSPFRSDVSGVGGTVMTLDIPRASTVTQVPSPSATKSDIIVPCSNTQLMIEGLSKTSTSFAPFCSETSDCFKTSNKTIMSACESIKRTAITEEITKARIPGSPSKTSSVESSQILTKTAKMQEVTMPSSNVPPKSTPFGNLCISSKTCEVVSVTSSTGGGIQNSKISEVANLSQSPLRYGADAYGNEFSNSGSSTVTVSACSSMSSTRLSESSEFNKDRKSEDTEKPKIDKQITREQWEELKALAAETGFNDEDLVELVGEYVDPDSVAAIAIAAASETTEAEAAKKTARAVTKNVEVKAVKEKVTVTEEDIRMYDAVETDIDWASLMSVDNPELLQNLLNDIEAIDSEDDTTTKSRIVSTGDRTGQEQNSQKVTSETAPRSEVESAAVSSVILSNASVASASSPVNITITKTTQIKTVPGSGTRVSLASTWRPISPDTASPLAAMNKKSLSGIKTVPTVSMAGATLVTQAGGPEEIITRSRSPVGLLATSGSKPEAEKFHRFPMASHKTDNPLGSGSQIGQSVRTATISQFSTPFVGKRTEVETAFQSSASSSVMTTRAITSPYAASALTQNVSVSTISPNTRLIQTSGKFPPFPVAATSAVVPESLSSYSYTESKYAEQSNVKEISVEKLSKSDYKNTSDHAPYLFKEIGGASTSTVGVTMDRISTDAKIKDFPQGRKPVERSSTMFAKSKAPTEGLAAAIASAGALSAFPLFTVDSSKTKALTTSTTSRMQGLAGFVSSKMKSAVNKPSSSKGIASAVVGVARAAVAPAAVVAVTSTQLAGATSSSKGIASAYSFSGSPSESLVQETASLSYTHGELTSRPTTTTNSARSSFPIKVPLTATQQPSRTSVVTKAAPEATISAEEFKKSARGAQLLPVSTVGSNFGSHSFGKLSSQKATSTGCDFTFPVTKSTEHAAVPKPLATLQTCSTITPVPQSTTRMSVATDAVGVTGASRFGYRPTTTTAVSSVPMSGHQLGTTQAVRSVTFESEAKSHFRTGTQLPSAFTISPSMTMTSDITSPRSAVSPLKVEAPAGSTGGFRTIESASILKSRTSSTLGQPSISPNVSALYSGSSRYSSVSPAPFVPPTYIDRTPGASSTTVSSDLRLSSSDKPLSSGFHSQTGHQLRDPIPEMSRIHGSRIDSLPFNQNFAEIQPGQQRFQPRNYELNPGVSRINVTLRNPSQAHNFPASTCDGPTTCTATPGSRYFPQSDNLTSGYSTAATTDSYEPTRKSNFTQSNSRFARR